MEERRRHQRYPAVFGSDIESEGNESRLGLTQDISISGARLLTLTPYSVDRKLKLRILVEDNDATECIAKVVRTDDVDDRGMWQCEIAVEFEELLQESLVEKLREMSVDQSF